MAIPSSAVQWILDSPQQMTIYRPRDYGSLYLWIGMAASIAIGITLVGLFAKGARGALWSVPIVALIGFFLIHRTYIDTATAVASKTGGTLSITNGSGVTDTYPLASVQKAVIETQDGNTRRMTFVLTTGSDIHLGEWAPRDGLNQAADAFNQFLGTQTQPDDHDQQATPTRQ